MPDPATTIGPQPDAQGRDEEAPAALPRAQQNLVRRYARILSAAPAESWGASRSAAHGEDREPPG